VPFAIKEKEFALQNLFKKTWWNGLFWEKKFCLISEESWPKKRGKNLDEQRITSQTTSKIVFVYGGMVIVVKI